MNAQEFIKHCQEPHYLGDGLYATFDGYQYCLFTQEGHKIYMEPDVIYSFNKYREEINTAISKISS